MTLMHGSPGARTRSPRLSITLAALACFALAAAGCSSSGGSGSSGGSSKPKPTGEVKVAYASSLDFLNQQDVFPAFTKATGFKTTDWVESSGALEAEIAAKEIAPTVFQSVGGDNITPLEPKFTHWYVQYAGTQMVVAYNPNSKYASQFKAIASGKAPLKDLFTLMEKPGFKLGRTDPNIDPQGRAFIFMLELAQMQYHLPSDTVAKIIGSPLANPKSPEIFSETSLDSTLSSGQLDAASAYLNQAIEQHLSYIALPSSINLGDFALADQYAKATVTIDDDGVQTPKSGSPLVLDMTIIGTPTPQAIAYVKYVLSPAGQAIYKAAGYTVLTPTATGTGVPAAVQSELGG
jgi:molybdate/tungstate transport system substrate-binding protein